MGALFEQVPSWLGWLGWFVLFAGYLMQRRALVSLQSSVRNTVKGNQNHVTNTVHQAAPASAEGGDSHLSQWGSWASIVGLVLTLIPMVKAWLTSGT